MSDETDKVDGDVMVMLGKSEDGHLRALRARQGEVAVAELRELKEGQPVTGDEIISLKEREGSPVLWDVEVVHELRDRKQAEARAHKGPAQVASAAYRDNWDAIFGALQPQDDEDELN